MAGTLAFRDTPVLCKQPHDCSIEINQSRFTDNRATVAAEPYLEHSVLEVVASHVQLTISHSNFTGNTAARTWGGAAYIRVPVVHLDHCHWMQNSAENSWGGALYLEDVHVALTVEACSFHKNLGEVQLAKYVRSAATRLPKTPNVP